ncbi:hypothetical protein [Terrimonas sp.]|uniref:hypothetical protein n=1 Tax=Terrimonas sp. TaxID=1914338 RepID=UPI00197F78E3|nr:hypothetical protein [Terrimonas sp.]
MKNVKVNAYQRGLVFKNEAYQRMLTEGSYWFWGNEVVKLYDITQAFNAPVELNILLQDAALADALSVLEVKDNEIALQYKNGLLEAVFTAGRYAFWKGAVNYAFVKADTGKLEITEPIERNVLLHRLVAPFVRSAGVESFEKAVLFIDGKFVQVLQPGVYYW